MPLCYPPSLGTSQADRPHPLPMCPCAGVPRSNRQPWTLLGRWSVLTYEAPKQSPPALKEEENGDSNIQVGTTGDGGLEVG